MSRFKPSKLASYVALCLLEVGVSSITVQAATLAVTNTNYFGGPNGWLAASTGPGVVGILSLSVGNAVYDVGLTQQGVSYGGACSVLTCFPFMPFFDSESSARAAAAAVGDFFNDTSNPITNVSGGAASINIAYGPLTWAGNFEMLIPVVTLNWDTAWFVTAQTLSIPINAVGDRPDNHCTPGFDTCTLPPGSSYAFFAPAGEWAQGLGEVPLPAALPLFVTGLGVLGLLGWRRKRKAAPESASNGGTRSCCSFTIRYAKFLVYVAVGALYVLSWANASVYSWTSDALSDGSHITASATLGCSAPCADGTYSYGPGAGDLNYYELSVFDSSASFLFSFDSANGDHTPLITPYITLSGGAPTNWLLVLTNLGDVYAFIFTIGFDPSYGTQSQYFVHDVASGSSYGDYHGSWSQTVPLPVALPLFATGLGLLGLLAWRRKQKAAGIAAI